MSIDAKYLIRKFGTLYRIKVGETYPPTWSRDMRIFNDLLKLYSVEKLESLLELYFNQRAKIYCLPFFKAALGELLQLDKEERESRPKPIAQEDDWRFE